jgi:hypothetical protein
MHANELTKGVGTSHPTSSIRGRWVGSSHQSADLVYDEASIRTLQEDERRMYAIFIAVRLLLSVFTVLSTIVNDNVAVV